MNARITSNIVPISGSSIKGTAKGIALRVRARRLQLGWSRKTLGQRAGVSLWTLKRFESSGQVALETLIKLAVALNEVDGLASIFPARADVPASMAELERWYKAPRKRGRTLL
jgi:transcriptional regulator with XRE-family HTH domain